MSGIQVHTSDPISPAKATKATAITPQTAYPHTQATPYQPAAPTSAASSSYPSAQPGQTVPTPTQTIAPPTNYGPADPQPGAVPVLPPPTTTAKATLPPPPKAGEKPQPPSDYTPNPQVVPSLPQPYPSQMSQPPLNKTFNNGAIPPHSTTSTATTLSYQPSKSPTTLPSSGDSSAAARASLEHPEGYVQNQYATEMTAEQRLAMMQQEPGNESSNLPDPVLGYVPNRARSESSASAVTGGDIWEGAKKYLGQVGEKVGEVEGKTWDWINGKH